VEIIPGVDRLIPLRQTSLSSIKPFVFSCPLDISSLHNLIEVFQLVETQVEMECGDGEKNNQRSNPDGDIPTASMGNPVFCFRRNWTNRHSK
jgi:hypothetical protein